MVDFFEGLEAKELCRWVGARGRAFYLPPQAYHIVFAINGYVLINLKSGGHTVIVEDSAR